MNLGRCREEVKVFKSSKNGVNIDIWWDVVAEICQDVLETFSQIKPFFYGFPFLGFLREKLNQNTKLDDDKKIRWRLFETEMDPMYLHTGPPAIGDL